VATKCPAKCSRAKRDLAKPRCGSKPEVPATPGNQIVKGEGIVYSRIGIDKDRAAHQTSPALGSTSRNSLFSHTKEPRFPQQLSTKAGSTPQSTIPHKFSITSI
jgi:hypothetical protein